MLVETDVFLVGVNVPAEFLQTLMDSISGVMEPLSPLYDRVFYYWPVKGTWRSLPGSSPYLGSVGETELADEMRLEFAVKEKDLRKVVDIIMDVHPYQEPAIAVMPMIGPDGIAPSDAD